MDNKWKQTQGTATANNGATSAALLAAPGANKRLVIRWGMIAVTAAGAGGGSLVSLKDGSTTIISFQGNTADTHYIELGDDGFQLSVNSALNLVVESAGSTQATALGIVTAYTIG